MAEKSGLTKKDSEKALNAMEAAITEELSKGGKVQLMGFGTFEVSERKARVGTNPKTKEKINIAASKSVKFGVGKKLKDSVNN
jgi:DNA-binding protein HU-beta